MFHEIETAVPGNKKILGVMDIEKCIKCVKAEA